MSGKLLDTNIIIKYLSKDAKIADIIDNISKEMLKLSVVVMGELWYGAEKSSQKKKNMEILKEIFKNFDPIFIDDEISKIYGNVKNSLKRKGINIPENDMWIAATAISKGFEVVTTDKHFKKIDGLNCLLITVA